MKRVVAIAAALSAAFFVAPALSAAFFVASALAAQPAPQPQDEAALGRATYARANCVGCHKWHGNGGGGYGGDAMSLRKTALTREQIAETVGCGRPGTGMPFFTRGAYDTIKCYGMNRQDAGDHVPPEANTFLRPNDIDAVTDYVIAHIKGKGEPNHVECVGFFGDTSRACDIYKTQDLKTQDQPAQNSNAGDGKAR